MNQEIKQKWCEALRSGKYEQGTGELCANNRYCCIGVLCEILNIPSEIIDYNNIATRRPFKLYNNLRFNLSKEHKEQIGLTDSEENILINANDAGDTFAKIADYIEKNL